MNESIDDSIISFEVAFEERMEQTPIDYLIGKIRSGSRISDIKYLFEIISAEICLKNKCKYKGFAYYQAEAQAKLRNQK